MLVECPECDLEGIDPSDPFWPCGRCHGKGMIEVDEDDWYGDDCPDYEPGSGYG